MRSQPRHYAPKHIILNQSFSSFLGSYLSSRQPWSPASLCSTHPPHLHTDMVGSGSETLSTHPPHLHIHMYIYMQYTSSTSTTHMCSTQPPHLLISCTAQILRIYSHTYVQYTSSISTHTSYVQHKTSAYKH